MRRTVVLALLLLAACEPMAGSWKEREEFPILAKAGAVAPEAPSPLRLKVMTWNVKYGAGRIDFWFDLWGDRTEMTRAEVDENMAGIYRLINELQPDVLITNEIEINSRRSAYYDMVKGILENTDLRWAAYTPNWQARFVPDDGVGRVDMGNCIFSRYPIVKSERIAQPERTDLDAATAYFYLDRAIGRAEIEIGGRRLAVYAVHTEAYDQDRTNSRQQKQILELVRGETLPFLLGGDLNALPPGSVKTASFPDEHPSSIGTEFEQPPYSPEDLRPFFEELVDAIGLERYGTTEEAQRRYYTHSVIGRDKTGLDGNPGFWNRRLDYLFVKAPDAWSGTDVIQKPGDSGVESDPMLLSDHCPVVGTWEVNR